MKKQYVIIDGVIKELNPMLIKSLQPWALNGRGVFETMKVSNGKIVFLNQHLGRLRTSLRKLKLKSPFSSKKLEQLSYESLRRNKLKNARMRLTIWQNGSHVRTSVVSSPYKPHAAGVYHKGWKVAVARTRYNEKSQYTGLKSIAYQPFMKAYESARRRGYDEAILLNRKDEVMEASRSNVFFVKNDMLLTPSLKSGCLNGITRRHILQLAQASGISCQETTVFLKDLYGADEAFLSNSLIGIMPMTSVNRKRIRYGERGPITETLMKKLNKSMRP